jgi:hypothetical protein
MYPQIPNPPIRISMPNLKSKPVALKTILVAQTKKKKKKKKKKTPPPFKTKTPNKQKKKKKKKKKNPKDIFRPITPRYRNSL